MASSASAAAPPAASTRGVHPRSDRQLVDAGADDGPGDVDDQAGRRDRRRRPATRRRPGRGRGGAVRGRCGRRGRTRQPRLGRRCRRAKQPPAAGHHGDDRDADGDQATQPEPVDPRPSRDRASGRPVVRVRIRSSQLDRCRIERIDRRHPRDPPRVGAPQRARVAGDVGVGDPTGRVSEQLGRQLAPVLGGARVLGTHQLEDVDELLTGVVVGLHPRRASRRAWRRSRPAAPCRARAAAATLRVRSDSGMRSSSASASVAVAPLDEQLAEGDDGVLVARVAARGPGAGWPRRRRRAARRPRPPRPSAGGPPRTASPRPRGRRRRSRRRPGRRAGRRRPGSTARGTPG